MFKKFCFTVSAMLAAWVGYAQNPVLKDGLSFRLNDEGTRYVRMTFLNQTWVRHTNNNPGSTVFGKAQNQTFDIGLRRTRIQLFGKMTERVLLYMQFGQNNFSYTSQRKLGAFFHDVLCEYSPVVGKLAIGGGLTGWSGAARYASPSAGTILSLDAPLFEQETNDINDQFLRKLSVYAKGKLGALDYRLALSKPFALDPSVYAINNGSLPVPTLDRLPANVATFSTDPPKLQTSGYVMWQFRDREDNTINYMTGAYLGKKRVFNIGAGFVYQPDAVWYKDAAAAVKTSAMKIFAADVFFDAPVNADKSDALTIYASYTSSDFGVNFTRNLGVMNPATGTIAGQASFNGAGNAFPMTGTGSTILFQGGYMPKKDLLGKFGALMPYIQTQYSRFDRLADPMLMYEAGLNWLINGHASKMTLNYQSRPIFAADASGRIDKTDRKGMWVLQYQILLQ
jgi:hypothetical protein